MLAFRQAKTIMENNSNIMFLIDSFVVYPISTRLAVTIEASRDRQNLWKKLIMYFYQTTCA